MDDEKIQSKILNENLIENKKIRSQNDEQDLVEDLTNTFKNTIENSMQLINNLINTVETLVSDQEIKRDTKETINNIDTKLKILLSQTKNIFSEVTGSIVISEEE